ncbi:MAG: CheR family methyltransferase [Bacteroidota bacterium]
MKIKKNTQGTKSLQRSRNLFPVVGVGASAGGLDAYRRLLKSIPPNSGIAFVLVQHLSPKHESVLPELLQKSTTIPVLEISDDISVEPDHIYIIPSNKMLIANDGVLQLSPRPSAGKIHRNLPIDLFFKSLAEVHQSHSIGVVLSGTASDGTLGLKAIRDKGGLTFVQDEESAAYHEMPNNAVRAGVVDFILPPEDIRKKILELTKRTKQGKSKSNGATDNNDPIHQILSILRVRKGTDFTYYKQTTIKRRILRRMALSNSKTLSAYIKILSDSKTEQGILFQDLLIPVTSFFRDPKMFDDIIKTVLPLLAKSKQNGEPLRIWVAGCSTGEEAYSLAICCRELVKKIPGRVQILASDLSEIAIAKARKGVYGKNALKEMSESRLKEFFTKTDTGYSVNKELREMCVFSVHNFLKDPPFGRMDIITCRNVLIYMEPFLQRKALATFHYALNPKGFLMLGKSETSGTVPELFSPITRQSKIFVSKDVPGRFIPDTSTPVEKYTQRTNGANKFETIRTDFQKIANEILLEKYAPPGVIVNEGLDIVHFQGNNSAWLRLSSGRPSHNLTKLSKPGLAFELRNLLHKAKNEGKPVKKTNISMMVGGTQHTVTFEAIPLPNAVEPYYLLLFHGVSHVDINVTRNIKRTNGTTEGVRANRQIKQLEHELAQTLDDMGSITADQESAFEELQSAHEELQSSSEELQSLNEEIETSREEVQSSNEELLAVNQELNALNEQLTEERDYANGIIETVKEPLVVLDRSFLVKTANKSFYETFRLDKKETEGKILYEVGSKKWDIPVLRGLADNGQTKKISIVDLEVVDDFPGLGRRQMLLNAREIVRDGGREKLILLAIEDITTRRRAEEVLRNNEERFRQIFKDLPAAVYTCDAEGRITFYNNAAVRVWGREPKLGKEQWCGSYRMINLDGSRLSKDKCPMAVAIKERRAIVGEEITIERPDGTRSIVELFPQPLFGFSGEITGAINMAIDITAQKEATNKIKDSEEKYRQLAGDLEKTVSQRTQELRQANETLLEKNAELGKLNRELESFAYISGNDLQEPLRKIQIFASRLTQEDQDALSDKGKDTFARIKSSALRMQALIKDLLSYSRSAEKGRKLETMELEQIVRDVVDEFQEVIEEVKAIIDVKVSGQVGVIPLQFHQLLFNLISNSLKFAVPGKAPLIQIKSEFGTGRKLEKSNQGLEPEQLSPDVTYCHISVSDNGIGFEEEYREKIFVVFQRLHRSDVYPGTGIGLAIVKRIVENHRGVIVANSKLNKGATFNIYIPELP